MFSRSESVLPIGVLLTVSIVDILETLGLGVDELLAFEPLLVVEIFHDVVRFHPILLELFDVSDGQALQFVVEPFFFSLLKLKNKQKTNKKTSHF